MFLKSIVLNGFKSFAQKRELLIHEGITGIVGPNGSGKSNIADAMRWVLGEQSSRNLRGSSMQEVIFKGTQTRPPKASCEVSLLFDNSDHHFNVPYTDVMVKRRLYRSGESEYSINGTTCRLRDIVALFRDTGLGRDGYSIIGQGRISRILDSRASERRTVFDEAAGIMKYRSRKEEAERNLAKTQENLTRIADIVSELRAQMEPLKVQIAEAREYDRLTEELRRAQVNILLYGAEQQRAREERLKKAREAREAEIQQAAAAREEAARKRLEAKEALRHHQKVLEALEQSYQEQLRGEQHAQAQTALYAQKAKDLHEALEEGSERLRRLDERIAAETKEMKKLQPELEELAGRRRSLQEELRRKTAAAFPDADVTARREEKKSRIARLREVIRMRSEEAMRGQRSLGAAVTELKRLGEEGKKIDARLASVREARKQNEERAVKAAAQLEKIRLHLAELNGAHRETDKNIQAAQQEIQNLDQQISSDRAKENLVREMLSSHEGYYESVRQLFSHLGASARDVYGTVADVIRVESRYETALETALGNAMQDVIVASDETAKQLIELLRSSHLGRVTFLPISGLTVRYLSEADSRAMREMGLLGTADRLVACEEHVRPAIDYLLARTVVAEDLDQALMAKRHAGSSFRLVTLQGDIIVPGGAITGGSTRRPKVSLLARKRMAEELADHRRGLEKRRQQAQTRRHGFLAQQEELQKRIAEKTAGLQEEKLAGAQCRSESERLEGAERELVESRKNWQQDYAAAQAVHNTRESGARAGADELAQLEEQLQTEEVQLQDLDRRAESLRTAAEERREELAHLEKELAAVHAQMGPKKAAAERAGNALAEASAEKENLTERLEGQKAELQNAQEGAQKASGQEERCHDAALSAAGEIETCKRRLRREEENVDFYEQQMTQTGSDENEKNKELYRLDAELEKCRNAVHTASDRLWTEHQLTWANALALREDAFSLKRTQERTGEIQSRISKLTQVNHHALEDWERLRERLEDLESQQEDLEAAKADLGVVIAELMRTMKTEFEEKFARINAAFSKTFAELFGGGSAELVLESGVPAMEAGVEIRAEPPGKKLQNITLLSDGEKAMTAIALCFAMLEVNPSPICLLDEIDAPLDDKNVVRLSQYLSRLKERLQFLIITHKKTTMSVCDALYGVAMHEKGVTDLVSVAID